MISQLRLYTINQGKMDEFVKAWKEGIVPAREKVGFKIAGAWVLKERNEFIWIMTYDGPNDWAAQDAAYFASPERKALNPDPAQFIARSEQYFITPVQRR